MIKGFITKSGSRYSLLQKDGRMYLSGGKFLRKYEEVAQSPAPRMIVGLPAIFHMKDGSTLKTSPVEKYLTML